jgi:5-methylcytosine-specific restriction endonuclease McrA
VPARLPKPFALCRFVDRDGIYCFVIEHDVPMCVKPTSLVRINRTGKLEHVATSRLRSYKGDSKKKKMREYRAERFGRSETVPCDYCGVAIAFVDASVDHVVALSLGGANDRTNYALACKPCNTRKGARLLHEFLAGEGRNPGSVQAEEPEYLDEILEPERFRTM